MLQIRALMKRRVFRQFAVSFALMFVLPVCVLVCYVVTAVNTSRQQTDTVNALLLERYRGAVESKLIPLMQVADNLFMDSKLEYFLTVKKPAEFAGDLTSFELMRTLVDQINNQVLMADAIETCYIYFPPSGEVVAHTVMNAQDFFTQRLSKRYPSYDHWLSFLHASGDGFSLTENGDLCYLRSIRRRGSAAAIIAVQVKQSALAALRQAYEMPSEMLTALYDGQGSPLLASDHRMIDFSASALTSSSGSTASLLLRKPYQIFWSKSGETGCTYVTAQPADLYSRETNQLLLLTGAVMLVMLCGGFYLCLRLARQSYQPIHQLVSKAGRDCAAAQDDFAYLEQVMQSLQEDKLSSAQSIRHQRHTMRSFVLERLLRGAFISPMQIEEDLLSMDIAFSSDYFVVAMLRVVRWEAEAMDFELMRFVARNLFDELLSSAFKDAQTVETSKGVAAILSVFPAEGEYWKTQLPEIMQQVQDLVYENFACVLSGAVSRAKQGYAGVHTAYEDVKQALSTCAEGSVLPLWKADELDAETAETENCLSDSMEQKLIYAMTVGDQSMADAILEQLHAQLERLPRWRKRLLLNDALCACAKVLSPTRVPFDVALNTGDRIQAALGAEGAPEDFDTLRRIVQDVCRLPVPCVHGQRNGELAQTVRDYIDRHYADNNLCVAEIAGCLGIGSSYASMLYRKETGDSILDAIHQRRMSAAKERLRGSKLSLSAIAAQTGYYNSAAFIRTFKKYEGITPGQYRTLHENE